MLSISKKLKVHQSLETATEAVMQEHVYEKSVRDADELKQRLIEKWSAIQPNFINRLIGGEIVLMHACQKLLK